MPEPLCAAPQFAGGGIGVGEPMPSPEGVLPPEDVPPPMLEGGFAGGLEVNEQRLLVG